MRKLAILFGLSLYTLYGILYTPSASAHLAGQPPFFKINGQYANLYYVPLTSLNNFELPQDGSPENYLVNQSLKFEFDQARLPAPPEVVAMTKFNWEFGDGSTAHGLSNTHTYTKAGSYILKIYADDGQTPTPQLIESDFLNILPSKDYQLPKAVILINGRQSKDPLADVLSVDTKQPVQLDALKSSAAGGVVDYFWDLGDRQSAVGATQTHSYPADTTQAFPVLRVKDQNGFFADSFVEIQNAGQGSFQTNTPPLAVSNNQTGFKPNKIQIIIGLIVLGAGFFMVRWWLRGRGRGKRR